MVEAQPGEWWGSQMKGKDVEESDTVAIRFSSRRTQEYSRIVRPVS